jgi:hypothetical protein
VVGRRAQKLCITSSSIDWPFSVFEKNCQYNYYSEGRLHEAGQHVHSAYDWSLRRHYYYKQIYCLNSNMVCINLVVCSSEVPYSNHSDRWPSTVVLRIPHYEHVIFGPCLRRGWLPLSEPGGDTGPSSDPHSPTSELIKTSSSLIKKEESLVILQNFIKGKV